MSGSKLFRGPFTKHSENVAIADTGDFEGLLTIEDSEGRTVYQVFGDDEQDDANADFVLRALNCHEDFAKALQSIAEMQVGPDAESPKYIQASQWHKMKAIARTAIAKVGGDA